MKQNFFKQSIFLLCTLCFFSIHAQEVLLEVGQERVSEEEFVYLYTKNNLDTNDLWSMEHLMAYAKRYADFRLKIAEAKRLGMDSSAAFQEEFNGYRRQLEESFLSDKKVTQALLEEAYARLQTDIRARHILISLPPNAPPEDTLRAYEQIRSLRREALTGQTDFQTLARRHSQDPSAKANGGDLGYFTALQMVYPFEQAAYQTPVGEISPIIRTDFGYHILKVEDRRPNRGKVQVAHIFLEKDSADSQTKIQQIHQRLQNGEDWNDLCQQFTHDVYSRPQQGLIKAFTSNGNTPDLLPLVDAAFALQAVGQISPPVRSAYGWHILRLSARQPVPPLDQIADQLTHRIEQDSRSKVRQQAFYDRLKRENGYQPAPNFDQYLQVAIDSALLAANWSFSRMQDLSRPLFQIGQRKYPVREFYAFLEREQRPQPYGSDIGLYVKAMYESYLQEQLLQYERQHLEEKYPAYRFLLREYYDGILFFEIMSQYIWNKAAQDEAKLKAFFQEHPEQYRWQERVQVIYYPDTLAQEAIEKYAKRGTYEKEMLPELLKALPWQVGTHRLAGYTAIIEALLPPTPQAFEEVRGQVIADYQQHLEAQWLEQLRQRYPVKINEKILRSLVKSE
ncbi:MAG: peptidylprolyl isomerase [Bernardetiaceae bacterium]